MTVKVNEWIEDKRLNDAVAKGIAKGSIDFLGGELVYAKLCKLIFSTFRKDKCYSEKQVYDFTAKVMRSMLEESTNPVKESEI